MRIAFVSCILVLMHIIWMTYLIYNPAIEEKTESVEQISAVKQTEMLYSKDGKYLVSVNYKKKNLKIFDITKGKEIQNFKSFLDINSVSYSPDGKNIAIMDKDKINLFNLETGDLTKTF